MDGGASGNIGFRRPQFYVCSEDSACLRADSQGVEKAPTNRTKAGWDDYTSATKEIAHEARSNANDIEAAMKVVKAPPE